MIPKEETIRAYTLENAVKHSGKASQGSVLSSLFAEGLEKSEIKEAIPKIQKSLEEVNSLNLEKQKSEYEKIKNNLSKRKVRAEGELPLLPNAEKWKVVMRFAPFPSGPLHIGNARPAIVNDEYCKVYEGEFILFIDDTIGSEEKQIEPAAYDLISEGMEWLGAKPKKILYKSDRNEIYYKYAEEMIKKGYMYVCSCPAGEFQELKLKGVDCPCRHLGTEINLSRWKKMFTQETMSGELVVRLKTSMQDSDPAFRDRVMLKISDRTHPKTKNKYRVYPTMEFSWGIDDHLIGTTHVLRGMEHHMSTRVQDFIRKIFGWQNPESIYTGLFQIEGIKISKSKGAKEVHSGEYIGWNDPRLWSLQSLRDRGFKPSAIREFILNMGITKNNSTVPIDVLYAISKKYLDESKRYFFVEDPEKIKISGCPEISIKIPFHPREKLGERSFKTSQEFLIPRMDYEIMQNQNYRLMHLLTFKSDQVLKIKPRDFSFVTTEPEKNLKTISWLPANAKNISVKILMDDGSIRKGFGEESLSELRKGQTIYFENIGFATLHKKSKEELEFFFLHV